MLAQSMLTGYGSFPCGWKVQCKYAQCNRLYLQYGFTAGIETQLLSDLVPI